MKPEWPRPNSRRCHVCGVEGEEARVAEDQKGALGGSRPEGGEGGKISEGGFGRQHTKSGDKG